MGSVQVVCGVPRGSGTCHEACDLGTRASRVLPSSHGGESERALWCSQCVPCLLWMAHGASSGTVVSRDQHFGAPCGGGEEQPTAERLSAPDPGTLAGQFLQRRLLSPQAPWHDFLTSLKPVV